MSGPPADAARRVQLADNLARVRERIERACARAGRSPGDVTLVVVTKTWPAADVLTLADLGVVDVGENRDQEAAPKAAACVGHGLRWHFVGQLQTNKARSVARYADVVHSVDRSRLVTALDAAAGDAGRRLACLVEVSYGGPAGRGGAPADQVGALADQVAASRQLDLVGLMTVAPVGEDAAAVFTAAAQLRAQVAASHPGATWLSAGMSGDLEAAVAAGATHVRVGTAVLGYRPPLR